ncbi:fasciclin domain-containing protein, partial [Carboxylicivirga linearis]
MKRIYLYLKTSLFITLMMGLMPSVLNAQDEPAPPSENSIIFNHLSFFNDLIDDIVDNAPYTIFLPTEDSFQNLTDDQKNSLFVHPYTELIDVLKGHMVSGVVTSADLVDGQVLTSVNGSKLLLKNIDHSWYVNDILISDVDIHLKQSVIHRIDGVLFPTTTVYDIISDSESHTTLEAAIGAAGLDEALMGDGPFTVFAPTDDAFAALPEGTVEALLEDPEGTLTQILLYHVVGSKAMSTDLSDGDMIVTLQGKEVEIKIMDGKVYINDAMVTVADIEADNGVVHVIDAVLLPPTTTVYDIISDSEAHNTLEAAVGAAGLDEALMGDGPFTVFAPTDDAFAALPEGTVEALLEDPEGALTQILL